MKQILIRWGLFPGIGMVLFFYFSLTFGKNFSYELQEVFGYAGMILSLIFVYFGIRQYRDKVNGGKLSFGKGLQVGMLIVLIPALMFGLFDVSYSTIINPGFWDEFCTAQLAKMKMSMSAEKYEEMAKQVKAQSAMFKNAPFLQFLVMFLTVAAVGLIITVISALILKRNSPRNATSS